ncbi:CPCC family cysteine-rich protein [Variovorax dokdonensis]|uniref:CPCC family cysteine-rich protein n=1 Tax=Variovorax dokdonensis TaxID=344883 RepID=A0ABT7N675_9BURK|nr:CPCC family cysteine-rich protein [Variovorax dokdonensis]MDM0043449.1 CPCC family cysteine-rich protein [Variovorax dokdonensis]
MKSASHVSPESNPGLPCPCCYHLSLSERGGFEICPICFWEDDGQDAADVRGGPNGTLSLSQARANYQAFGASDMWARQYVRPPHAHELP